MTDRKWESLIKNLGSRDTIDVSDKVKNAHGSYLVRPLTRLTEKERQNIAIIILRSLLMMLSNSHARKD